MAKVKVEAILVVVAMVVALCSVGAAAKSFPKDCVESAVKGFDTPGRFCCIAVQDEFLTKSAGIAGYCKAVKAAQRKNGPLAKTPLEQALAIPGKCRLGGYFKQGSICAGGCHYSIPFVSKFSVESIDYCNHHNVCYYFPLLLFQVLRM